MTIAPKTNPLLAKPKAETASLFPNAPETSKLIDAVCREHGVNRTVRVRADLDSRVVNPLLKLPNLPAE